ncbi:MAG: hypothetical protein OIF50_06530 [Flavobacteriaceae bacterium]|nr:hypothetical protein [Flavobacteriaceae bacterium]
MPFIQYGGLQWHTNHASWVKHFSSPRCGMDFNTFGQVRYTAQFGFYNYNKLVLMEGNNEKKRCDKLAYYALCNGFFEEIQT